MLIGLPIAAVILSFAAPAGTADVKTDWPGYQKVACVIKDDEFVSGETLPEVKITDGFTFPPMTR